MVFVPPSWVPQLPFDPPDSISICDFMLDERYGRHPLGYSQNPFTCGATGKTYSSLDVKDRVDFLARGLAKELGFDPNKGSEWDKVIAVFSVNTVSASRGMVCAVLTHGSSIHYLSHGLPTASAAFSRPRTPRTVLLSSNTS
jgi:hypothetical protein